MKKKIPLPARKALLEMAFGKVGEVFSQMQTMRQNLLREGASEGMLGTREGNRILALGQLLETGKNAMKDRFTEMTMED